MIKHELLTRTFPRIAHNSEWYRKNYDELMWALKQVRKLLTNQDIEEKNPVSVLSENNALKVLSQTFSLSDYECNILLLCLGMDFDFDWETLCINARGGDRQRPYPTLSIAMSIFPDSYWTACAPTSPLRQWKLIDINETTSLSLSPLKLDERILHYILGDNSLDQRLRSVVKPATKDQKINVPSHQRLADQIAKTWVQPYQELEIPVIQLCGDETASKRAIAATACQQSGLDLYIMSAGVISSLRNDEIRDLVHLWHRESILQSSALLLDCDDIEISDPSKEGIITRLIENLPNYLIVSSPERKRSRQRPLINFDVHKPSTEEQRYIWSNILDGNDQTLHNCVNTLVSHFSLNASAIHTVCLEAKGRINKGEQTSLSMVLWDTCRSQARPRLHELAQPMESGATWEDLVLPDIQRQVLQDISAHVRQRMTVYEKWGFGKKGSRGLGISALFAGPSGTGKTLAAEVIANELHLDLYRIDLSQVVSKYIGETEKNLRRVFDAAEYGGAILLFDEADALFGKRSEVKDSHDRHANIEVGYLLQRMEAYRGLAILTTNLKSSLDQAFLRRIRFIVQFPFPDANQREEIWQRIFPKQTPTKDLDPELLAQLNVSGGNIRNIALNAAFLAADAGEEVQMKHLLQSAKSEYAKLERPLTDAEVRGWV